MNEQRTPEYKLLSLQSKHHLDEGVPSETGVLLSMSLLDDLTGPGGHSAVQQALADTVGLCDYQLSDLVHSFLSQDLHILTITLKLDVTLQTEPYCVIPRGQGVKVTTF